MCSRIFLVLFELLLLGSCWSLCCFDLCRFSGSCFVKFVVGLCVVFLLGGFFRVGFAYFGFLDGDFLLRGILICSSLFWRLSSSFNESVFSGGLFVLFFAKFIAGFPLNIVIDVVVMAK